MADIPVVPNVEGQPGRELARRVRPWDWNLVAVIRLLMHEPAARQPWSWLWLAPFFVRDSSFISSIVNGGERL